MNFCFRAKVEQYVDVYEDFIGVKSVRQAQEEVMKVGNIDFSLKN